MGAAEDALAAVRRRSLPGPLRASGVDVHFQPDAPAGDGRTVLEAVAEDLRWRTQFETGTSNGGLTAHPGGDRWRWESRLFGGAYDAAPPGDRPVYGGLRTTEDWHGAAPRFGSAHLRLRSSVLSRTTLCYPDSVFEPAAVGTPQRAGAVTAALTAVTVSDLLDRYVEAHVHGGLRLADVGALVLDPSHRGTGTESAARRTGLRVEWHQGFVLRATELPALTAYRGRDAVAAATAVASGGVLTPALLGRARAAATFDPQTVKHVWHLLAAFGR